MKVRSTHEVEISREELAGALGYDGTVVKGSLPGNTESYVFEIEGNAKPASAKPVTVVVAQPGLVEPPPPPPAVRSTPKSVLIIEFETTDDPVLMHAYATELQTEIRRMLDAHPEQGVTARVSLR